MRPSIICSSSFAMNLLLPMKVQLQCCNCWYCSAMSAAGTATGYRSRAVIVNIDKVMVLMMMDIVVTANSGWIRPWLAALDDISVVAVVTMGKVGADAEPGTIGKVGDDAGAVPPGVIGNVGTAACVLP